ncbi:uncharacterized protein METZ01_LOCUS435409, partial [marine metagenome]
MKAIVWFFFCIVLLVDNSRAEKEPDDGFQKAIV